MALESGTRLGPYEVLAPIGDGSGERYKASDVRASRLVALKVLPPEFAADPDMQARLERDTRTLSSLGHPGICRVVDVGHQDPSIDFLVTEYAEGELLADRLRRGALPLHEALSVAIAMADALDKAHRQGVVHGGLNPSSVLLTAVGPTLLDFGLVSHQAASGHAAAGSMVTTRTSLSSLTAVPAYAAPYRAPEQFVGDPIDARTDIYALGAVLHEMVTGKPAFHEKTQALLIAAVQTVDPDPLSTLQPAVPAALEHLVARCLNKDPRQRVQTAFDVKNDLQWIARGGTHAGEVPAAPGRRAQDRLTWAVLAAAIVAAAVVAPMALATLRSAPEPGVVRFFASGLPIGTTPVAISPDGRWLIAGINGGATFGVSLDSVTAQTIIRGVPVQPFFSPDGRSIAYFEGAQLKRADIGGGPPQIICETPGQISAGTWNTDGVILFPAGGVIQRVLAAGGQPTPITALDVSRQETEHLGPAFLPDGRRFVFLALSSDASQSAIYVGSLDSPERTRLFASESRALYAAPGYLLFNRGDTVFAQAFDADTLTLAGEPIRVASGVPLRAPAPNGSPGLTRSANFAVSQTGVLVYRTGVAGGAAAAGVDEQRTLFWFNRSGQRSAPLGTTGPYAGIDLSPDGRRVAVHRHDGNGGDNWFFDLAQGRMQRLTFNASQDNSHPVWSPDGTRVAFASVRNGRTGIYVKLADGTGTEELVTESEIPKTPNGWSSDGRMIVYTQNTGAADILAVPVAGDRKPVPLLQSPALEAYPQVSPDGRWLAYMSNETGRAEVYVRPFPDGPGKWQVSTDGGQFPRWRGDGRELIFYFNNNMIAADIRVTGSSVEPGVPRMLFGLPNPSAVFNHGSYNRFAVSADGQRFLISQGGQGPGVVGGSLADAIATLADQGSVSPSATPNAIAVVLNWTQLLTER